MLATIEFILGIVIGAVILVVARRRAAGGGGPDLKPTSLTWWTLGLGLSAAVVFALGTWSVGSTDRLGSRLLSVSITLSFAAVVVGVGTLLKHDRRWPTWVGLIAGLIPALAWIAFAGGHILGLGE